MNTGEESETGGGAEAGHGRGGDRGGVGSGNDAGDGTNKAAREDVVVIAPNGARRTEPYRPNQKVRVVLADAVREFTKDGLIAAGGDYLLVKGVTPLAPEAALDEAGVRPNDELKIRSRAIPDDGAPCTPP